MSPDPRLAYLAGLERAAVAVAKSDIPTSCAYEAAREVWRLWWRERAR